MSDEQHNKMSPVMNATPDIQKISERPEVIYSAIDALYRKHHEHKLHHLKEEHRQKHIANWKVTKYAEEQVIYGINYFLKVSIDDGLYIHIRIHRSKSQDKYDFYALHEIIRHNIATCVFTEGTEKNRLYDQIIQYDPLTYFNY